MESNARPQLHSHSSEKSWIGRPSWAHDVWHPAKKPMIAKQCKGAKCANLKMSVKYAGQESALNTYTDAAKQDTKHAETANANAYKLDA